MPITVTETTTPGGWRALRSVSAGVVGIDDVKLLQARYRPGSLSQGWPLLSLQGENVSFTVDGRSAFVNFGEQIPAVAVVVTSAPLRVMLSFIVRASQAVGSPSSNVKFFRTEPEAQEWLDAECSRLGLPRAA